MQLNKFLFVLAFGLAASFSGNILCMSSDVPRESLDGAETKILHHDGSGPSEPPSLEDTVEGVLGILKTFKETYFAHSCSVEEHRDMARKCRQTTEAYLKGQANQYALQSGVCVEPTKEYYDGFWKKTGSISFALTGG